MGTERVADCMIVNVKNNIFAASALGENSRVSSEDSGAEYQVVFDFYRSTKNGCRKAEFVRYLIDGDAPVV